MGHLVLQSGGYLEWESEQDRSSEDAAQGSCKSWEEWAAYASKQYWAASGGCEVGSGTERDEEIGTGSGRDGESGGVRNFLMRKTGDTMICVQYDDTPLSWLDQGSRLLTTQGL